MLLNEAPFLMTHDAASGYLGHGLVDAWTRTQEGGFKEQLSCGARALDARPKLDVDLGLVWHHGGVTIPMPFNDSIADVIEWCAGHPEDLVLLAVWDCVGDGCMHAATAALAALGVPMVSDCSDLRGMTLEQAETAAQLDGGGKLLALVGDTNPDGVACAYGNYNVSVTCSGFVEDLLLPSSSNSSQSLPSSAAAAATVAAVAAAAAPQEGRLVPLLEQCLREARVADPSTPAATLTGLQLEALTACGEGLRQSYDGETLRGLRDRTTYRCYQSDPSHTIPFSTMFSYLDAVAAQAPREDGQLVQMQALWQETAVTVVLGSLELSSLVRDERRSDLNAAIVAALQQGRWGWVNLLEVNNVCHNGPALLRALQGAATHEER